MTHAPLPAVAALALAVGGCQLVLGGDFEMASTTASSSSGGSGGHGGGHGGGQDGGGGTGGVSVQWQQRFGDPGAQQAWAIGVDGVDDIWLAGRFKGTIDLGGEVLGAVGNGWDVFLGKLAPDGSHRYSKRFGDGSDQNVTGLAIDGSNNVVLIGDFVGSFSFGGATLTSQGAPDAFVAKFDAQGNPLWSSRFGTQGQQVLPLTVACGQGGSIFVAGIFKGTVSFGGQPVTAGGPFDAFVVEYDSGGIHQSSMHFPGLAASNNAAIVAVAGSTVWLAGSFSPSIDLDGTLLTTAGQGETNSYVAMLDWASHKVSWIATAAGSGSQWVFDLKADGAGNALAVGVFTDAVDWGGGPAKGAGGFDVLLAKLGPSGGAPLWSHSFGSSANDSAAQLAVGPADEVVTAGIFGLELDLGGGPLAHVAGSDVFVAGFGADGAHRWSIACGGPSDQWGPRLARDGAGDVLVAATFKETMSCGGEPLQAAGDSDVFIAKLRP